MKLTNRYAPKGYCYVDKQLAEALICHNVAVTIHMNNVNFCHVFGGWHLGWTIDPLDDGQYNGQDLLGMALDFDAWRRLWDEVKANGGTVADMPDIPYKSMEKAWRDLVDNFVDRNEGELGTYPVFCVSYDDITAWRHMLALVRGEFKEAVPA